MYIVYIYIHTYLPTYIHTYIYIPIVWGLLKLLKKILLWKCGILSSTSFAAKAPLCGRSLCSAAQGSEINGFLLIHWNNLKLYFTEISIEINSFKWNRLKLILWKSVDFYFLRCWSANCRNNSLFGNIWVWPQQVHSNPRNDREKVSSY